ncbi:MAG: MFS transporter [Alphaproteobacteria bacterium]|nr:MFS transporter [Alphaproteobacteria bacterium]
MTDRPTTGADSIGRRLTLIREADFRRLWFIGGLGEAMRWLEIVAISIYVFDVTQSALTVALVNFARGLPSLLFGPAMGSLAERVDRRLLMILSAAIPMLTVLAIGLGAWLYEMPVWPLAVASFLSGIAFTTELPVRRTMIGEAAGMERIAAGMGLDGITRQITRIIGPGLGGYLLREIGLAGAFLLAAVVYGLCTILSVRLTMTRPAGAGEQKQSLLATLIEGLQYVRTQPALLAVLSVSLIGQMFIFPYMTLIAPIGKTELALDAFAVGLLTSSEGVGAMSGALAVALWARPAHFRAIYLVGAAMFAGGILGFALAPSFELALLVLFLGGLGLGGFSTMQTTLLCHRPPRHARPYDGSDRSRVRNRTARDAAHRLSRRVAGPGGRGGDQRHGGADPARRRRLLLAAGREDDRLTTLVLVHDRARRRRPESRAVAERVSASSCAAGGQRCCRSIRPGSASPSPWHSAHAERRRRPDKPAAGCRP